MRAYQKECYTKPSTNNSMHMTTFQEKENLEQPVNSGLHHLRVRVEGNLDIFIGSFF